VVSAHSHSQFSITSTLFRALVQLTLPLSIIILPTPRPAKEMASKCMSQGCQNWAVTGSDYCAEGNFALFICLESRRTMRYHHLIEKPTISQLFLLWLRGLVEHV
jgi:hypothetical protein